MISLKKLNIVSQLFYVKVEFVQIDIESFTNYSKSPISVSTFLHHFDISFDF